MKRAGLVVACVLAAMLWRPTGAAAQTEPRVLMLDDDARFFQDYWVGVQSVVRIERRTGSFESFMGYLRSGGGWDYIVFVYYRQRSPQEHAELAHLLEDHLSRGGTLSFTYPHLDAAPELWEVLGVASAEDPVEPEDIVWTPPRHPSWITSRSGRIGIDPPPRWGDFGDAMIPMPGGRVIGEYEISRLPVMLETRDGRVLVNGLTWDDWSPASRLGAGQTAYLTMCIADFDDDGKLDFFDFLVFQDAFAAREFRADLDQSGTWDFLDFLAFQDAFAYGCSHLR